MDTEKATEPYFWVLREQDREIYPREIQLALTDALHHVTQGEGRQVEYDMTGGRVYTLRLCAKRVLEKVPGAKLEDAELVGIQMNTSEAKQDEPLFFCRERHVPPDFSFPPSDARRGGQVEEHARTYVLAC